MKKYLSIIVALSLAAGLLAGCSTGAGNGGSSDTQQAEQQTESAQEEEQAEAADETGAEEEEAAVEEDAAVTQADAMTDVVAEVEIDAEDGEEADEAEEEDDNEAQNKYSASWDCPNTGFEIVVPEQIKEYKGQFYPADIGQTDIDASVLEGHVHYLARTDEEAAAFKEKALALEEAAPDDDAAQEEYSNLVNDYYDMTNYVVVYILGIRNDRKFEDVLEQSYWYVPILETGEIGTAGDYNYYYAIADYSEYEAVIKEALPEDMYAELQDVMANGHKFVEGMTVKEPVIKESGSGAGTQLSFETKDLSGNAVSSADLFGGHKVTMINLWATWCGPCINELADLEELNKEFEAKDCQIVGICIDTTEGQDVVDSANDILANKGATYTNLAATDELLSMMAFTAVPTSYFVDSEGVILTSPVVGADFEGYRSMLEKALENAAE